ncbi:MAG: hypothetical protein H8E41_12120 [Desulfobulbaceae bacterium]|uniref:Uncharacterized protein n=1 Tax=Candidatus Desulfobia pelagia TaxID=2841692 RepID=A0A8J6NEM5_9BACT|nr:hypothetical protein [Candidatus Desulfobia pelagia]
MNFKKEWDLEMALAVLENKTVDSKIWAEAVEWLLLYGPPHIKELLGQASSMATGEYFPELQPTGYTDDGEPLYNLQTIAESLGITQEEAAQKLAEKEIKQGVRHLFDESEGNKVH